MFGGKGPSPPPPPPPPPNPPSYASAMTARPSVSTSPFGAMGNSLMNGPLGAPDLGMQQRKSLFGQ